MNTIKNRQVIKNSSRTAPRIRRGVLVLAPAIAGLAALSACDQGVRELDILEDDRENDSCVVEESMITKRTELWGCKRFFFKAHDNHPSITKGIDGEYYTDAESVGVWRHEANDSGGQYRHQVQWFDAGPGNVEVQMLTADVDAAAPRISYRLGPDGWYVKDDPWLPGHATCLERFSPGSQPDRRRTQAMHRASGSGTDFSPGYGTTHSLNQINHPEGLALGSKGINIKNVAAASNLSGGHNFYFMSDDKTELYEYSASGEPDYDAWLDDEVYSIIKVYDVKGFPAKAQKAHFGVLRDSGHLRVYFYGLSEDGTKVGVYQGSDTVEGGRRVIRYGHDSMEFIPVEFQVVNPLEYSRKIFDMAYNPSGGSAGGYYMYIGDTAGNGAGAYDNQELMRLKFNGSAYAKYGALIEAGHRDHDEDLAVSFDQASNTFSVFSPHD